MENAYLGEAYSDAVCHDFLHGLGVKIESYQDRDDVMLTRLAEDLTDQQVIGFFQGRFEWGPRALGNRSILADPRFSHMKEIVNTKIKYREPFRPVRSGDFA
jgi:carbamoyltransferase